LFFNEAGDETWSKGLKISPTTNPTTITVRPHGYYIVTALVGFTSNAAGRREVWVNIDGSVGLLMSTNAVDGNDTILTGSYVREIGNTAIEFGIEAYQNSGGALETTTARFSVCRIR
jgi:hypothetical protein